MDTETAKIEWDVILDRLAEPFPASAIFWRAGVVSRDKQRAQALPYAEPRIYEDRLNEVCPGLWNLSFRPWGDSRIICDLSIGGLTRSSTGEENEGFAPGTAAEAQAFKRACVKYGLGRYMYDIPIVWVSYDEKSRKLAETPTLPEKFLPVPKPKTLLNVRASGMHRELAKVGVAKEKQYEYAGKILGRAVGSFMELTEAEGSKVYNTAKAEDEERNGKRAA